MKEYLVLIREPDGRTIKHSDEEIKQHQSNWAKWLTEMQADHKLVGGKPLSLVGAVIRPSTEKLDVHPEPYQVNDSEIVGGYLILKADSIHEAVELMKTCPVYEFDGFVEVRESM